MENETMESGKAGNSNTAKLLRTSKTAIQAKKRMGLTQLGRSVNTLLLSPDIGTRNLDIPELKS